MILFYFLLINYSLLRFDYAEFDNDIPQQLEYRTLDILVLYKSLYRFVLDSLMKYQKERKTNGKEEEFYLYNVFHLLKSKYLTADYRPTSRDVGVSQYNTTLILFVWKT